MSVIAALMEAYATPEEDIEITLSKGEVLKFRRIADYDELCRIKREAANFHKSMLKGGALHPDVKPFAPREAETAAAVYLVAHLSIEPKFEHLDLMKMSKRAHDLFNEIVLKLDVALSVGLIQDEAKEFNEAKNESGQTSDGETA